MRTLLLSTVLIGLISGLALADGGEVDSTRSQTVIAAEYFLDTDPGEGNGVPVTATFGGSQVTINLSVNPPENSALYLRVQSSNTTWSAPRALVTGTPYESPNATITAAEYFVGLDPGEGNGLAISLLSGGRISQDLPGLNVGQAVYVRYRDSAGRWSAPRGIWRESAFPSDGATLSVFEYFVGVDPGPGQGTAMTFDAAGQATLELPSLLPGQVLGLRAKDSAGRWGDARIRRFEFDGIRAGQMFARYSSGDSSSVITLSIEADSEPGSVLFTGLGSLQTTAPIDSVFVRFQSDTYTWGPWFGKLFFGAPELLYPSDEAPDRVPDVVFRWRAAADADSYDLQLAEDAAFDTLVRDLSEQPDTSVTVNDLRHGRTYYWRVRSVGDPGTSDWSPTWSFTIRDLLAPALASPADGAVNQESRPLLVWRRALDAADYQVQVAQDESFGDPVSDLSALIDSSATVGPLLHETPYFWRVRSTSGPDTSAWSGVRDFTVRPLDPPALVSPASGTLDAPPSLVLDWQESREAEEYQAQLATDALFSVLVVDRTELTSTQLDLGPLLHQQRYYWRVRASNPQGTSAWSGVRDFSIRALLPPPLVSPAAGEEGVSTLPQLVWREAVDASTYDLQLARDAGFTDLVAAPAALPDTAFAPPTLERDRTYHWRVRSVNPRAQSDWSGGRSFSTQPLEGPELLLPANGAADQPPAVTFSWNTVTGALEYRLQVARDAGFTDLAGDYADLTATAREVTGLRFGRIYYWRVEANDGLATGWSASRSFQVRDLAAPQLSSPAAGVTNQPLNLQLSWQAVGDAASYHVQLARDAQFSSLVDDARGVTVLTRNEGPLEPSTSYHWRLRSIAGADSSAWSPARVFSTLTPVVYVVYPGDANHDGQVDARDVLAIGQHYNRTGPPRPGGSLAWGPQPTEGVWTPEDAVYADCDGNGTIAAIDVLGIVQNWRAAPGLQPEPADPEEIWLAILQVTESWGGDPVLSRVRAEILNRLEERVANPLRFEVSDPAPNPFRESVRLDFRLPRDTQGVGFEVFDLRGRKVASTIWPVLRAGKHSASWSGCFADGTAAPAGVYFYRLEAGGASGSGRVLLLR